MLRLIKMTNVMIKIIDTKKSYSEVDIDDLTKVGIEILISDCDRLLSKLKDKFYEVD